MIIDVAIPGDARVKDKELEKIEKYQLREEIRKLWKLKKVTVVPVVIGALGAVSDKFDKHIKKLGTTIRLEVTARINGFSPNLHSANIMQTYVYSRANL